MVLLRVRLNTAVGRCGWQIGAVACSTLVSSSSKESVVMAFRPGMLPTNFENCLQAHEVVFWTLYFIFYVFYFIERKETHPMSVPKLWRRTNMKSINLTNTILDPYLSAEQNVLCEKQLRTKFWFVCDTISRKVLTRASIRAVNMLPTATNFTPVKEGTTDASAVHLPQKYVHIGVTQKS